MSEHNEFRGALEKVINHYSLENGSDTPDFILAMYLSLCLDAWDKCMRLREDWYGRSVGGNSAPARKPDARDEDEQAIDPKSS